MAIERPVKPIKARPRPTTLIHFNAPYIVVSKLGVCPVGRVKKEKQNSEEE
jgi:hypothetical protein